jgi:putative SOS response-associated peptidase YedK
VCGRATSTTPPGELARLFDVAEVRVDEPLPPRYNVAPTDPMYAVATRRSSGVRQLGLFRWGLVPSWAPDVSVGARMINARAETVEVKAAYRDALVRRRCIIPIDSFYEWHQRRPVAIALRDRRPMALAGLWDVWRDPADPAGDSLVRSCVIITSAANSLLAPIHDRMPVVLDPAVWDAWLDPANNDVTGLRRWLVPAPADRFEMWPVSTRVNSVANDGPELLDRIDPPAGVESLPGLF